MRKKRKKPGKMTQRRDMIAVKGSLTEKAAWVNWGRQLFGKPVSPQYWPEPFAWMDVSYKQG